MAEGGIVAISSSRRHRARRVSSSIARDSEMTRSAASTSRAGAARYLPETLFLRLSSVNRNVCRAGGRAGPRGREQAVLPHQPQHPAPGGADADVAQAGPDL